MCNETLHIGNDKRMNGTQRREVAGDTAAIPEFPVRLVFGGLVALFFSPYIMGLAAFPHGDFDHHFLPFSLFQQNALLNLRLPVWVPYANSGHPFLADAQSAVFYPISNLLLLLTGFVQSGAGRLYWLQLEAALHVFLAGIFTYMLVRRLTGRQISGFAAGSMFAFSGYITGYPLLQLGVVRTAVWLPLILLLLLPQKDGRHCLRRWLLAACVQAVAYFAGHPQTFLFLTYAVAGWMLMLAFVEVRNHRFEDRESLGASALGPTLRVAGLATAFVAALVGMTLGQLWPAFEFAQRSVRAFVGSDYLSGGFPLQDTWQFFFPGVLSHFSPQYIGVAGLGLVLFACAGIFSNRFTIASGDRVYVPAALFFAICGVLSWLLSYGENGPLYEPFVRFAPGGSLFRGQERAIYLVVFCLSVLGGYGVVFLTSLHYSLRRNLSWGFAGVVGAGAVLFIALWPIPEKIEISRGALFLSCGKSIVFAAVFAYLCSARKFTRSRALVLLPVLLIDLFLANVGTNVADGPTIRAALDRPEVAATLGTASGLAGETEGPAPRVYNENRLPRSSGISAEWEDVGGSSPLRTIAYDSLFTDVSFVRLWELTGVGTVLTWREELPVGSRVVDRFDGPDGSESRLHRLETVWPRAWWTNSVRRVDDRSALALLADANFDPRAEVLVAESDAASLGDGWEADRLSYGGTGSAMIDVEQKSPTHLVIGMDSDQPGFLFVSENHMPGWRAEWTEADTASEATVLPVVRAHQAFLGIPVPAGKGTLELAYRPASVRLGLALSAFSWLALLFVLRGYITLALGAVWRQIRHSTRGLRSLAQSDSGQRANNETHEISSDAFRSIDRGLFAHIRFHRAAVLLATLAGFALRFYQLDNQELIVREAFAYWYSQLPLTRLFHMFSEGGSATFSASYWLNHYWLQLAGSSEFALRSISALLGTLAIPLFYCLARELRLPAFAALTATLLMAVGSYTVRASQDVLLYPLSLTLSVASAALAVRLISGSKNKADFIAYVLCTAATFYTQVFAILALVAQNLYVLYLLAREDRSNSNSLSASTYRSVLTRWAWAQLSIVALCIPWILSARNGTFDFIGGGTANPVVSMLWWRFAGYPIGYYVPGRVWLLDAGIFGLVCIAAAIIGEFLLARRRTSPDAKSGQGEDEIEVGDSSTTPDSSDQISGQSSMVFILLLLVMAPFAFWDPLRRHWFMYGSLYAVTLPPYSLLMGIGLTRIGDWIESWLGWRWRAWTAVDGEDSPTFLSRIPTGSVAAGSLVLILVAGNLFTWRSYHSDPEFSSSRGLREVSNVLEGWSAGMYLDEVHILQSFPDPTLFLYYYQGDVEDSVLPRHDHDLEGAKEAVNALRDSNVLRIILPVSLNDDQEGPNLARQALASSYQLAGQETFGPWQVELYSRPYPEAWLLLEEKFANGLVLERVEVSPQWPPADGRLVVHMEWRGDPSALTGGEKVFLHLVDESGNLIAQWDPEFRMESADHSIAAAMPIPSEVPDGSLRLLAGLYDVSVEGAPRILTDSGEDVVQIAFFRFTDCDVCGR